MNLLRAHGSPTLYRTHGGRHCDCVCCEAADRAYHAANYLTRRDTRLEYHRARRAAEDKDVVKEQDRLRYLRERERRQSYQRAYYQSHRDECIARANKRKAGMVGSHTKGDVTKQFERQRGKCFWCGTKLKGERGHHTWHVDHVVPLASGGTDWPENIVCACPHCNHTKAGRHPMDFDGRMF